MSWKLRAISMMAITSAAAMSLTACGGPTCGDGTQERDGACVPVNVVTCGDGTTLADGACVFDGSGCASGTTFNADTGACELNGDNCDTGTTWDMMAQTCVPDSTIVCGEDTIERDGACVPDESACGAGTELNAGRCVVTEPTTCGAGTQRDANSGECVVTSMVCGPNTAFDAASNQCSPTDQVCQPGTTWNEGLTQCAPDAQCQMGDVILMGLCVSPAEELAANPDATVTEPDDAAFGGTPASLDAFLMNIGDDAVFTGAIEAPADLDNDMELDQDVDQFTFTAAEGDWYSLTVQSLGRIAPAFRVDGPNGYVRFSAAGLTADAARRIVTPWPGTYTVTVMPLAALLQPNGGPYGDDSWRYVGSVEKVDAPMPTDVDLSAGPITGSAANLADNLYRVTNYNAGEFVSVTTDEVGEDVELAVYIGSSTSGVVTYQDDIDAGDTLEFQVPSTGDYFVFVDWIRARGTKLDYSISGQLVAVPTAVGPIAAGMSGTGAIGALADGDESYVTFSLDAGEFIEISHDNTEGEPLDIVIYDASGQDIGVRAPTPSLDEVEPLSDVGTTTDNYIYAFAPTAGDYYAVLQNDSGVALTNVTVNVASVTPNDLGTLMDGQSIQYNTTVDFPSSKRDLHKVTFAAAVELLGTVTRNDTSGDVDFYIYDDAGQQVFSDTIGTTKDVDVLLVAGTYYINFFSDTLVVGGFTADIGITEVPNFEVEPNDDIATATPINVGDVNTAISDSGALDFFRVTLAADVPAGQSFFFNLEADSNTPRYTCTLHDAQGTPITTSGPRGTLCSLYATGLTMGDYIISIEQGPGGDGQLYRHTAAVVDGISGLEPNEDLAGATDLSFADLQNFGLIGDVYHTDEDEDWYKFTVPAAAPTSRYGFSFARTSLNATGTIDWEIQDAAGVVVDSGDWDDDIFLDAPAMGDYYLVITRTSSSYNFTGQYLISVEETTLFPEMEPNNDVAGANTVNVAEDIVIIGNSETTGADADYFTVVAPSDGLYRFALASPNTSALLELRNSAGDLIREDEFGNPLIATTFLYAGETAYVVATGNGSTAGTYDYELTITSRPLPAGNTAADSAANDTQAMATAIPFDTVPGAIFGAVRGAADEDWYSFTVAAPGDFTISAEGISGVGGPSGSLVLAVQDAQGGAIAPVGDVYTLTAGPHFIRLSGYDPTGDNEYQVNYQPPLGAPDLTVQSAQMLGLAIPDADPTNPITSAITVAGVCNVGFVTVDVDITHTFRGDLEVFLISPDGTRLELISDTGGPADDLIGNFPNDFPVTGGSLGAFAGNMAAGDWTLEVGDDAGGDFGTLNEWGLNFYCL